VFRLLSLSLVCLHSIRRAGARVDAKHSLRQRGVAFELLLQYVLIVFYEQRTMQRYRLEKVCESRAQGTSNARLSETTEIEERCRSCVIPTHPKCVLFAFAFGFFSTMQRSLSLASKYVVFVFCFVCFVSSRFVYCVRRPTEQIIIIIAGGKRRTDTRYQFRRRYAYCNFSR
jgi:hypothetical protein